MTSDSLPGSAEAAHPLAATVAGLILELQRATVEIDNLKSALESNRDIGAATGVLMARRSVTQQQAFDLLRIASQHGHRKLRDVAADVLLTGNLPEVPAPTSGRASTTPPLPRTR